ncbi:hypothetical protein BT96DRAFT_944201 [Gymnopus androsaceus JB14]|uniref:Uncharacterized protein n=1 Tax=Gymnopus androsaceus JB14 TaxID=1447944 RepID=A0A6A4H5E7_9AGAR|nr:hypothetical protein BT96DRAFT_944201 [Gymnopus androsaceus JB14]
MSDTISIKAIRRTTREKTACKLCKKLDNSECIHDVSNKKIHLRQNSSLDTPSYQVPTNDHTLLIRTLKEISAYARCRRSRARDKLEETSSLKRSIRTFFSPSSQMELMKTALKIKEEGGFEDASDIHIKEMKGVALCDVYPLTPARPAPPLVFLPSTLLASHVEFFSKINHFIPILHSSAGSILDCMNAIGTFSELVLSMCALGARYSSDERPAWPLLGLATRHTQLVGAHRRTFLGPKPSVGQELRKRAFLGSRISRHVFECVSGEAKGLGSIRMS